MTGTIRTRGDRYALTALRNKRATIAAEIVQLERQLRHRRENLVHVDATLRLLDPSAEPDSIPNKRIPKHINLFRQGELSRLVMDTLRMAQGSLGTADVVAAILQAGGHGEAARRNVAPRVRSNLQSLWKQRKVTKAGSGTGARWAVA